MNMKKSGPTNHLNLSGMNIIQKFAFLERLYKSKIITNYTDDGWVCIDNEQWVPAQHFVDNYGDDLTNEYSRSCGQSDCI